MCKQGIECSANGFLLASSQDLLYDIIFVFPMVCLCTATFIARMYFSIKNTDNVVKSIASLSCNTQVHAHVRTHTCIHRRIHTHICTHKHMTHTHKSKKVKSLDTVRQSCRPWGACALSRHCEPCFRGKASTPQAELCHAPG